MQQFGHAELSTFGIGADLGESQWRAVIRQLLALGHLGAEGEFHTLQLTDSAREVLRGAQTVRLRVAAEPVPRQRKVRQARGAKRAHEAGPPLALDEAASARYAALKAWRAEVAREHNLPAYVVFHDATLAEMARSAPESLDALSVISGVGAKKLEAYGSQILGVLQAKAEPAP